MAKIKHKIKKHIGGFKQELLRRFLTLSTSGFGLVAALAWNELIKEVVGTYIKPAVGGSSGVLSLLIYSVLVTILAVIVTYSLTKVLEKK